MSKIHYKSIVRRFQAYVSTNLSKSIYTAELAQNLGVSARTLYTAVVSTFELSPHRYIHLERLRRVREVLLSGATDAKISAIARDCGFNHAGEFSRAYQIHFGELPSETVLKAKHADDLSVACVNDRSIAIVPMSSAPGRT